MSVQTIAVKDYSNMPNEALVPQYQSMVKEGFGIEDEDTWIWNVMSLIEVIKERNLVIGIVAEDMRSRAVKVFAKEDAPTSPIVEIERFLKNIDEYDEDELEDKLDYCDRLIEWIPFAPLSEQQEARELFYRLLEAIKKTITQECYQQQIARVKAL